MGGIKFEYIVYCNMKNILRVNRLWAVIVGISMLLILILIVPGIVQFQLIKKSLISVTLPHTTSKVNLISSGNNDSFFIRTDTSLILVSKEGKVLDSLWYPSGWIGYEKDLGIIADPKWKYNRYDKVARKLNRYSVQGSSIVENGMTDLIKPTDLKLYEDIPSGNVALNDHCITIDVENGGCMFKWVTGKINNKNVLVFDRYYRTFTINETHTVLILSNATQGVRNIYIVGPAK